MKKRIVSIFLTLVLTLSLAGTALAAGTTVKPVSPSGKTVTATLSADGTYIDLTVTGLTSGAQYLVLMVSGILTNADIAPTESTIKYIDQASAKDSVQASSKGEVTFKVYPSSMQSSTILLSGSDVRLTIVATVEVPYKLGDINEDNSRDMLDMMALALHIAQKEILTGVPAQAADVNQDGSRDMLDMMALALHIAGKEMLP